MGSYHEEDLFFERHSTQLCRRRKKPLLLQAHDQVRNKILADGLEDETFDVTNKGRHLDAQEFNEKLQDKNTIVIDMRNHYEHEVGRFENAITPDVDNLGFTSFHRRDHPTIQRGQKRSYCIGRRYSL